MQPKRTTFQFVCLECGEPFTARWPNAKRCSSRCRQRYSSDQSRARKGLSPLTELTVVCAWCRSPFKTRLTKRRFCSRVCQVAAHAPQDVLPMAGLPRSTVGAASELQVAADLMRRGFHVFRALSAACPCDLVAWREGGPILRVEVKTARVNGVTGRVSVQKAGRNIFDVLCHVTPTEVIYEPPIETW